MKGFCKLAAALAVVTTIGCATQVTVTPTHRENMAAQSKVLAIAARNLAESVRQYHSEGADEEAIKVVYAFQAEAENFAGTMSTDSTDDKINTQYEHLIEAYVKLKQTFPKISGGQMIQESFERVQHEWEQLARTSGYANRAYQKKVEDGK